MKKQLLAMALGLTFAVAANAADAQYRLVFTVAPATLLLTVLPLNNKLNTMQVSKRPFLLVTKF